MAAPGKYCKAYSLKKLREFSQWIENNENTRKEKKEVETNRQLTDDDFLYLHDNYVVTDGVHQNENVIFDYVTPEWQEFCTNILKFKIPVYEVLEVANY